MRPPMTFGSADPSAAGPAPVMRVRSASAPAPGRPVNEDLVFRFGPLVGVLDGATVPEGFDTGCVHGPGGTSGTWPPGSASLRRPARRPG